MSFRYYRLNITEANATGWSYIGQIQLYDGDTLVSPSNMTGDSSPSPYVVSASVSNEGDSNWRKYFAFDSYIGSSPVSGMGWNTNPSAAAWIKIDLGVAKSVNYYKIYSTNHNVCPKAWTLEGSSTGSFSGEEIILDSQSNKANWGADAAFENIIYSNFDSSGWDNYFNLTIDHTKIDADITDFPLSVTLSSGTGITGFDATDIFTELADISTPDSYTKLLLHPIGDISTYKHPLTFNGNPKIVYDATASGTKYVISFDGTGDYITAPDNDVWTFGSNDFTIDFWIKLTSLPAAGFGASLYAQDGGAAVASPLCLVLNTSGNLNVWASTNGSTWGIFNQYNFGGSSNMTTGVWHHVAFVRKLNDWYYFIDGVLINTTNAAGNIYNASMLFYLGGQFQSPSGTGGINGYLADYRFTKGLARWTSGFTPPIVYNAKEAYTPALTWSEVDKSSGISLSNEYLTATRAAGTAWHCVRATNSRNRGKWYWETTINSIITECANGIGTISATLGDWLGKDAYGYGYNASGGQKTNNNTYPAYGASYTTGDIIGCALDLDNGKIWWAKNGVWQASGNPVTAVNPAFTGITGDFMPMAALYNGGSNVTITLGDSSFVYSIPDGFKAYNNDYSTKLLIQPEGDTLANHKDITINGNAISSAVGKFDQSYYFDGSNDYISMPANADYAFDTGNFTIDFWIRFTTVKYQYIASAGGPVSSSNVDGWSIYWYSNTIKFAAQSGGTGITISPAWAPVANVWYYVAITRSTNTFTIYINGVSIGTGDDSDSIPYNASYTFKLGTSYDTGNYLAGYLSEFRISKGIVRWTSNFDPPRAKYHSNDSIVNSRRIAISTDIDGTTTSLPVEIDYWDYINQKAQLWTRVPTVSSGTDTVVTLWYSANKDENSMVGHTGSNASKGVWDSNFKLVYHMSQSPINGAGCILDSTSKVLHGTPNGSMDSSDLVTGPVHKALNFDGADDYISTADNSAWDFGTGDFTIDFWANITGWPGIAQASFIGAGDSFWHCSAGDFSSVHKLRFQASGFDTNDGIDIDDYNNIWHHITYVRSSGVLKIYWDNTVQENVACTTNITGTGSVYIGKENGGSDILQGSMAEVRISSSGRTEAFIKANYYNVYDDLITFTSYYIFFYFSNQVPDDLSTVYGKNHQLLLTVTLSGSDTEYVYDAYFYDSFNAQIGSTVSGTESGQPVSVYMDTISGTTYGWYVLATSSGYSDTSATYQFVNKFLCQGYVEEQGVRASGIPIRLHRRSNGEVIGSDISSTASGIFSIETDYNEEHYIVALHPDSNYNALIFDRITP